MASEGGDEVRALEVSEVASRLFGVKVPPDAVIDEALDRATDQEHKLNAKELAKVVEEDLPAGLSDAKLKQHPLAIWIETQIGLDDGQKLKRRPPITISAAAQRLAEDSGKAEARCREQIQNMLTLMSQPASERGGSGERAFLAFKLHRFISGAGFVYSTLKKPGERRVTLDGQKFDPDDGQSRLYATFFCRSCGQEFHPVSLVQGEGGSTAIPRSIDEAPIDEDGSTVQRGYLMPQPAEDAEYSFTGAPEDLPEEWTEDGPGGVKRVRSEKKKAMPRQVFVDATGDVGDAGRSCLFLPGKFQFCPYCKDVQPTQAREINKLAGLSAEGRSSATTVLVSSALRWMNQKTSTIRKDKASCWDLPTTAKTPPCRPGTLTTFSLSRCSARPRSRRFARLARKV